MTLHQRRGRGGRRGDVHPWSDGLRPVAASRVGSSSPRRVTLSPNDQCGAFGFGGAGTASEEASRRPGHCLGQFAQPGGLVDRFADDGVLEAFLGADVAGHHLAGGHPDAGLALGHLGAQPLARSPARRTGLRPRRCPAIPVRRTPPVQASPSNLLTQPLCLSTSSTTTVKNRFSRSTTSTAGRLVTSCVEPMMSTKTIAAWRSSPPRWGCSLLGRLRRPRGRRGGRTDPARVRVRAVRRPSS